MKKLVVIIGMFFTTGSKAQQSNWLVIISVPDVKGTVKNVNHPEYNWNKDSLYSVCNLKQTCNLPWDHYIVIGKKPIEPDGYPVYGPQGALIGYLTKHGFAATFHRDHLARKKNDLDLLENPAKMKIYLVKIGVHQR